MIAFLALSVLLVFAAVAVLVLALRRAQPRAVDRERVNVAIFRERQAELDADLAAGRIDAAQHAALLAELELLLVDNIEAATPAEARRLQPRTVAIVLVVAIPALVAALFRFTGFDDDARDWLALDAKSATVAALPEQLDSAAAEKQGLTLRDAARLRQTMLQRRPEDAEAWFRLGISWIDAEVPMLAQECFRTALQLAPGRMDIALALARTELALDNGHLTDEIRGLLDSVLAAEPHNQDALLVYGMAGFESGDYATAVARWRQLLAELDPKSQGAGLLRQSIAKAEAKAKEASAPGAGIAVHVALAPELGTAPADATLFVIVRAAGGPPMPIAARKLSPHLPVDVTLTDADQMITGAPLAQRGPLEVRARLSRSGMPMPASGDLESEPVRVQLPLAAPLSITIDRRVP